MTFIRYAVLPFLTTFHSTLIDKKIDVPPMINAAQDRIITTIENNGSIII